MGHDDHDHGHDHGHDHAHDHDHDHGRPDLAAGAGAGRSLFLDAPSGLAGDMIIAALVDLGVPPGVIEAAAAALPIAGYHLHFGTRTRSGIVGTSFDVHVDGAQPERTYAEVRAILDGAPLAPNVRARAHASFRRLAESEAKVHRSPLDQVHFHEVGAIDALVDIVGSSAALEHVGATVLVGPLPMGRGFVKARHGVLPLPAPATVECLKGFATYDGGRDFEFVTPTGAAIVAAHATATAGWPSLRPVATGWGAGRAELPDRPNLLRAVLGERGEIAAPESHMVIEANLDDATGELVAHAIERLLAEGALDAWATPITMKKGRPAVTLSAICPRALSPLVSETMLRETTSLGVRRYPVSRVERPRRVVTVETPFGAIPVKIAEGPFGPPQAKPEFDACRAAAEAHGVPVRSVLLAAISAVDFAKVKLP